MTVELDPVLVRSLLDHVAPYYAPRDPAHGITHIQRLVGRLGPLSVGVDPPPRSHMLAFLGCFHGLASELSADAAFHGKTTRLLESLGWTSEDIGAAIEMVPRHLADPKSSEENIVHDANYVELLGAFGIAKAFTTGGARGQDYPETIEKFEKRHLDRVVFRTPMGQRLAEEGRAYAKAFLRRLERELEP